MVREGTLAAGETTPPTAKSRSGSAGSSAAGADARHRRDRPDRFERVLAILLRDGAFGSASQQPTSGPCAGPLSRAAAAQRRARNAQGRRADGIGGTGMKITLGKKTFMLGAATTIVVGGIALARARRRRHRRVGVQQQQRVLHGQLPRRAPGRAASPRGVLARARPVRRVPHGPAAHAAADDAQGRALPRAARHDHRLPAAARGHDAAPGARLLRELPLAAASTTTTRSARRSTSQPTRRTPRCARSSSCTPAAARRARRRRAASTGTSTRTSST